MKTIRFDLSEKLGPFKPLNATNGGPWHKRHADDQYRSNLEDYKAARIPFARNHDSAMNGVYGGPYSHDISRIFPDFGADPLDPASYDFACTDEAILVALDAGTKTFFRIGQTTEHQIKKHATLPRADFAKWAVVCEHVIRHYTEGWADGFTLDMPYWEIWNEPDLDADNSVNKRCWGGTKAQFFDFFATAATHLKKCFPHLKIGGPALAFDEKWADDFLREMRSRGIPLDFFSWHIYAIHPESLVERAVRIREMLVKHGYGGAESILNEWNYVKDWGLTYVDSLKTIHGIKGAAFTMACICAAQAAPIDMLMYYDTRPSVFNGAFDYYTYEKLKGYYPLAWYGKFYDMTHEIRAKDSEDGVYTLCGTDDSGKVLAVVAYYTDSDDAPAKTLRLDFGRKIEFEIRALDAGRDAEVTGESDDPVLTLRPNSCVLLTSK